MIAPDVQTVRDALQAARSTGQQEILIPISLLEQILDIIRDDRAELEIRRCVMEGVKP